jgi:hypothetical protein
LWFLRLCADLNSLALSGTASESAELFFHPQAKACWFLIDAADRAGIAFRPTSIVPMVRTDSKHLTADEDNFSHDYSML